jgi:tetratricopeptide (TPR) repeat protein
MKKAIVMLVLLMSVFCLAMAAQQPAQTAPQQKVIKNPAEYNAYMAAVQTADPNGKAIALEGFLQQYSGSVVKEDALEQLMAAYQQANNLPKVMDAAARLLQVNADNLRGLAMLSYLKWQQAQQTQNPQSLVEAGQYADRGLKALQTAPKPDGVSDADFAKMKAEMGTIFNSVSGVAALQAKNYAQAQQLLGQAVKANPGDLNNVYSLAISYLQAQPPDYVNGLWYIARAANLAAGNAAAQQQLTKYGRSFYIKYHGTDQGWQDVIATAGKSATPPEGFTISPRPTPAQEAAQLVQQKQVKDMSFDEFQLIFTSGNEDAVKTVWSQLSDKPIAFAAKVIEVTPTTLTLSSTADDIEANVADVTVTMAAPLTARLLPKVGSMTQVEATPVSYTVKPFKITMTKGQLIMSKSAPTPAKPATSRRP